MDTAKKNYNKIIISIVMALVMAVSMVPSLAFAESAGSSTAAVQMQVPQNLEDYTGLQLGSTRVGFYMLNCGTL